MSVDFVRGKWRARISVNRRRVELGRFSCRDDAKAAYCAALSRFGPERIRTARPRLDASSRFESKIDKNPISGCWEWRGAVDKDGYGKFQLNEDGRQTHVRAHRFSFFLSHGDWPSRLVLHRCDNPRCVNPDHLEDGDQGKNVRDCVARGRHRCGHVGRTRATI